MFKCNDCSKIFENKPDYCDCGNNVFAELGEKKREAAPFVLPFSYFALTIFLSCIILSILTILFFGNNWINQSYETPQKKAKIVQKNIPDIEKVWKSSPIKNEISKTEVEEIVQEKPVIVVTPQINKTQKASAPKIVRQNTTKISKPATKTVSQVQQKPQQTKPVKKQITKSETTTSSKSQSSSAESIIELNKYKAALRKALFFNLEILAVQGKGDCIIEFNIDDSGKLINRNFYKTSDNPSVNNAVYKMMMKLPQYYPPPPSYKGEKLKLKFEFDNGSYEINYV